MDKYKATSADNCAVHVITREFIEDAESRYGDFSIEAHANNFIKMNNCGGIEGANLMRECVNQYLEDRKRK